jgi:hypothetical protein
MQRLGIGGLILALAGMAAGAGGQENEGPTTAPVTHVLKWIEVGKPFRIRRFEGSSGFTLSLATDKEASSLRSVPGGDLYSVIEVTREYIVVRRSLNVRDQNIAIEKVIPLHAIYEVSRSVEAKP